MEFLGPLARGAAIGCQRFHLGPFPRQQSPFKRGCVAILVLGGRADGPRGPESVWVTCEIL